MITPAEINNKEFSKKVRGYDIDEVDAFLDLIIVDLEKLIKENLKLKAQLANMEKTVGSIGGTDLTVKDTLESAKIIMDDLAVSSEKRAKILVENAEMDAAIIIKDAKMKAEELAANSKELKITYERFRREYGYMLERLNREFEKINEDIEIDRLSALIDNRNETKEKRDVPRFIQEATGFAETVEEAINRDSKDEVITDDGTTMVNIKYE